MPTIDTSYDNRQTCVEIQPSSCVAYTGYVSTTLTGLLPCRPNINDVLKNLQIFIDKINTNLGDNTTLTKNCFTFNPTTDSQKVLNQEVINDICTLQTQVSGLLAQQVDPDLINVAIDLLCLDDPTCTPQSTYTLTQILTKLVTNYCSLLNRIINIESVLNI